MENKKTKFRLSRDSFNEEAASLIKEMQNDSLLRKYIPVEDEIWRDGYTNGYIIGREKTTQQTAGMYTEAYVVRMINEAQADMLKNILLNPSDYLKQQP